MDHPFVNAGIAIAVASALIYAGVQTLGRLNPSSWVRVVCGTIALAAGLAMGYPLVFGADHPLSTPWALGIAAALAGLGINQVAAPARAARRAAA